MTIQLKSMPGNLKGKKPGHPDHVGEPEPNTGRSNTGPNPRPNSSRSTRSGKGKKPKSGHCVFIGPSSSGKSWVFRALYEASNTWVEPAIKFTPDDPLALQKIAEDIAATTDVEDTRCHVSIEPAGDHYWKAPETYESDIYFIDSPGGSLFRTDRSDEFENLEQDIIDNARNAASLVICVDAMNPDYGLFAEHFPRLITKMSEEREVERQHSLVYGAYAALLKLVGQPLKTQTRKTKCLNFDNVLFLLTKIDQLADSVSRETREVPIDFVRQINPVAMIKQYLGMKILTSLYAHRKPKTRFAVGVCSAMGFHPYTGETFSERQDAIMNEAIPYGVREALLFITTGRFSSPVVELKAHDLHVNRY